MLQKLPQKTKELGHMETSQLVCSLLRTCHRHLHPGRPEMTSFKVGKYRQNLKFSPKPWGEAYHQSNHQLLLQYCLL